MTRSWLVFAAVVVTALPAASPAVAAVPVKAGPLPHAVGGYVPSSFRTPARAQASASEVLPASVDLRQYAPSPGDQGQIGACVAWTIAYSIMGYYANRTGGVGAPYAPLYLYMRNVAPGGAPSAGLNPDYVLANAQTAGVDTQDDYWQGTTNWQTPPNQAQITNARNYRVAGWSRLFNGPNQGAPAQTAIMQTLASGSPVALGIPVFRDFMYLRSHSLYTTVSGTSLGGHMIAAYGYDAQGVYIRNSWGGGWGNGGDAKLSWGFITRAATGGYAVNGISTPASPIPMAPTVGALSTVKAPPGASVTITGAGLSTATAVSFGGDAATFTPQTVNGLTKLVAVAPAHATGLVDVTVTNPSGTSLPSATSKFTYLPPVPGITTLSPETVTVLGGTRVTLTGTGLTGLSSVKLGTTTVAAKVLSPTTLTFVAPARTAAGPVTVTVSNASGTSTPAGQLSYVNPPAPVITSMTPNTGPTYKGTPVVVQGTDFAGVTRVLVGEKAAAFTRISGTQLRVTVPIGAAGQHALRIVTPGGTSAVDSASTFTAVAPLAPVVTSIVPAAGLTFVRTPVVVTGENFTDSTRLTVDGVAVSYTRVSATQVKVLLPAHLAGPVDLQLTTPGGRSATGVDARFTYTAPPVPVVTGLSVPVATIKVSTSLTITGTGFTGASRVFVGGTALAFTRVSDTQLRLLVPARATAGSAPVTVVTPGGTSQPTSFAFVAAGSRIALTGPTW
ncbi:IPT/TIG domain-containing protein [Actinoplanes sp. NPDC049599]|uniref:IPT/TIG domain-containing protein n=1 Tax=Actinoplanes sp. NPDC049599 TaxID=3363903 RepID=UPI00378F280E